MRIGCTLYFVLLCQFGYSQYSPGPTTSLMLPDPEPTGIHQGKWLSTEVWLSDQLTLSFGAERNFVSGIRLIYEPQFGTLIQRGDDHFDEELFNAFQKFGVETNLYQGLVSVQGALIFGGDMTFDSRSKAAEYIINSEDQVTVDYGFAVGLSFFQGLLAVGYGQLFYDARDFDHTLNVPNGATNDAFVYISWQSLTSIRNFIQLIKKNDDAMP